MLNHKAFGGFLMGIGISILIAYFMILFINVTWALIVAVSIAVSLGGIMFFWLGFKIITTSQMPREEKQEPDKI